MSNFITQFLEILSENDFKPVYRDIPDEVDNREQIISDIQEILDDDGHLPDSLRYFKLNGESDSKALTSFLNKSFQQFKTEFLAAEQGDNESFKNELLQQLDEIKTGIEQVRHEANQLRDDSVSQMLTVKTSVCDEVIGFIKSTQDSSNQKPTKKKPVERLSFKWLKGDDLLQNFFDKMKSNELIAKDTDINDFKAIFSNKPVSEIDKLIQWEKGAKLFAYFFHKLIVNNYIPKKPSWVLLQYCFTYNRVDIGKYVPMYEGVKSNVTEIKESGAPEGDELVDKLFTEISD